MPKFLKYLYYLVLQCVFFAILAIIIDLAMGLFFETDSVIKNLSITKIADDIIKLSIIFLVVSPIFTLLSIVRVKNDDKYLSRPKITSFGRALIYFPVLPLIGVMLSMPFVRLFQILGIGIKDTAIVISFTLAFWVYGIYLCKTKYFKINT